MHSARAVIDSIDWECKLALFHDREIWACGASCIHIYCLVFKNVEEGIVLIEDDCFSAVFLFDFVKSC